MSDKQKPRDHVYDANRVLILALLLLMTLLPVACKQQTEIAESLGQMMISDEHLNTLELVQTIGMGTPHDFELSDDDSALIVATTMGTLVYDYPSLQLRTVIWSEFPGHVQSAISANGRFLATSTRQGIQIWDIRKGKLKQNIALDWPEIRPVLQTRPDFNFQPTMAFNPNETLLAVRSTPTGIIQIFDVDSGELWKESLSSDVRDVISAAETTGCMKAFDNAFHPEMRWSRDGKYIAASMCSIDYLIWDITSDTLAYGGRGGGIADIAFSHNDAKLAVPYSQDIVIWNDTGLDPVDTQHLDKTRLGAHEFLRTDIDTAWSSLDWSPDDTKLLISSGLGAWYIVDTFSGEVLLQHQEKTKDTDLRFYGAEISHDGSHVLAGDGSRLGVWDSQTGALIDELLFDAPVGAIAFTADNATLALGTMQGNIIQYDTHSGEVQTVYEITDVMVLGLQYTQDDAYISAVIDDGNAVSWQVSTGVSSTISLEMLPRDERYFTFAMPTGDDVLYTINVQREIEQWDLSTYTVVVLLDASTCPLREGALAVDNGLFVWGGSSQCINVWDSSDKLSTLTFDDWPGGVYNIALNSEKRLLALGIDQDMLIYDLDAQQVVQAIEIGSYYRPTDDIKPEFAWSPDGEWLAYVDDYNQTTHVFGTVLWHWETNTHWYSPIPNDSTVSQLVFSPDSTLLAINSADGFVSVWRIPETNH